MAAPSSTATGSTATGPGWWWNPLTYIAPTDPATGRAARLASGQVVASETRADRLAAQLVTSARPVGARVDAYFDTEAENLISLLLLAAACGDQPLTCVYSWLTSLDDDATDLLRSHGFTLQAQALFALTRLPDKQREGVYGTARSLLSWLRNRDVHPWITPDPTRPAFDPRRIRHLNRHPLPLEQGRSGLRRPAGRRPHHGRPRRPRRPSHPLTRRPVGGAVRRCPRRDGEHLPDPAPRRLLLPLRVPRHHPAHDPAVLGTRRRSVGRRRHREAVVECERPHLRRRCRRPRLPPPAVRPHRHRRTAAPHRQHRPRTAHHHPHHPGQTDPHPRPSSASSPKDGRSCSPPAPPPSSPTPSPGGKDPTPPPSTPHSPKQGRQPRDHHRAQRRPGTTASSTSTTPPPHRSPPAGAGPAARDVRSRDGRGTGWPSKPGR